MTNYQITYIDESGQTKTRTVSKKYRFPTGWIKDAYEAVNNVTVTNVTEIK